MGRRKLIGKNRKTDWSICNRGDPRLCTPKYEYMAAYLVSKGDMPTPQHRCVVNQFMAGL